MVKKIMNKNNDMYNKNARNTQEGGENQSTEAELLQEKVEETTASYETNVEPKLGNIIGGIKMNTLRSEKTIGLKDFRSNISSLFDSAINNYNEIFVTNAKRGGKTATFLSSDLLKTILNIINFKPAVQFDEVTNQWAVMIEEIGADGCGDSKEDAINMAVENAIMLLEDYIENKELYIRMENMKAQYPYFFKLLYCSNFDEVKQALNLK